MLDRGVAGLVQTDSPVASNLFFSGVFAGI